MGDEVSRFLTLTIYHQQNNHTILKIQNMYATAATSACARHSPDCTVTSLAMITMSRPSGYSGVFMCTLHASIPTSLVPTGRAMSSLQWRWNTGKGWKCHVKSR